MKHELNIGRSGGHDKRRPKVDPEKNKWGKETFCNIFIVTLNQTNSKVKKSSIYINAIHSSHHLPVTSSRSVISLFSPRGRLQQKVRTTEDAKVLVALRTNS